MSPHPVKQPPAAELTDATTVPLGAVLTLLRWAVVLLVAMGTLCLKAYLELRDVESRLQNVETRQAEASAREHKP